MDKLQQTLNEVLAKVGKIETVEAQLTDISQQISSFDSRLSTLEGRTTALEGQYNKVVETTNKVVEKTNKVDELEASITFLSKKYDEMKVANEESKNNFAKLQHEVNVSKA